MGELLLLLARAGKYVRYYYGQQKKSERKRKLELRLRLTVRPKLLGREAVNCRLGVRFTNL